MALVETVVIPPFQEWPKISRLNRNMVVTEKIDGTNAAIHITDDGDLFCQSRKKLLVGTPDNAGFRGWAEQHKEELVSGLGPGLHFGEWYGKGIQRGYGLDQKRFALFNTSRWNSTNTPSCVEVVPILCESTFSTDTIQYCLEKLRRDGSMAVAGWGKPEGVIVYHTHANQMFKVTLEKDEVPKGAG